MPQSTRWFLEELERRGVSRREFMSLLRRDGLGAGPAQERRRHASPRRSRRPRSPSSSGSSSRTAPATPSPSSGRAARRSPRSSSTPSRSTTTRRSWPPPATAAEENLAKAVKDHKGKYIAVVEGSIPTGDRRRLLHDRRPVRPRHRPRGLRGRAGHDRHRHLRDVRRASGGRAEPDGRAGRRRRRSGRQEPHQPLGLPGQRREPDGADRLLPDVQELFRRPTRTAGRSSPTARPIHDNCERRAHYDAGQYVEAWGDEGHRTGYCLYKMGCKGPVTFQNCPNVRWNERHQLADRLRAPVHRLRRARLLGQDDSLLPAPLGHPRLRRPVRHRQGRRLVHRRRRRRLRRPRPDLARQALEGGPPPRNLPEPPENRPKTPGERRAVMTHVVVDPVTRIEGHLRIEAEVDGGQGPGRLVLRDDVPRHRADPEGPRSARRLGVHPAHLRRLHDGARDRLDPRRRERHRRRLRRPTPACCAT